MDPSVSQQHPSRMGPGSSLPSPVQPSNIVLDGIEYSHEELEYIEDEQFFELVMEGKWAAVAYVYRVNSKFHKKDVKERGTALHMAVNNGNEGAVKSLVDAIVEYEESALEWQNEQVATPLHFAALRGFTKICKWIIGEKGERKHLIEVENEEGETPLFWAVLAGRKETFKYLHDVSRKDFNSLITNKRDSILHCAIRREFFDLAAFILHNCHRLSDLRNNDEVTPLEVLATRPSAFMSGSNLSWWKRIIYYCISVDESEMKSYSEEKKDTFESVGNKEKDQSHLSISLCPVLQNSLESVKENEARYNVVPPTCVTFFRFVSNSLKLIFSVPSLSQLGISGGDLNAIEKMKQKHMWGRHLLNQFMEKPYESYIGNYGDKPCGEMPQFLEDYDPIKRNKQQGKENKGNEKPSSPQTGEENKEKETTFLAVAKSGVVEIMDELNTKISSGPQDNTSDKKGLLLVAMKNIQTDLAEKADQKETAYLAAAKNGIVEIVSALQSQIQSAIHDTNSKKENVLLVAVKNRQPLVVKELKEKLDDKQFEGLIYQTDDKDNNVLHLAAGAVSSNEKTWQISGAAMQMMWDIKWYKYIKALAPEHFDFRNNKDGKTPGEVFKEQHKELVKDSSEWMKETSESCSVVAALIAGVSFATASTVPGGNEDNGKPALEGQPAFDVFAIASLVGLCFSVSALVMFLAILTSRKQAEDFNRSLPVKLLLGLSSLFISIASMLIAFCAGHFFVLKDKYKSVLFPIYVATCLPVTFYAVVQFPLYADLVKAIFKKIPPTSGKGVRL